MIDKNNFLKTVHDNEAMKKALEQIKSKSERETAVQVINEVVGSFYENLAHVFSYVQNNSEELKKVVTEKEKDLIIDSNVEKPDVRQED